MLMGGSNVRELVGELNFDFTVQQSQRHAEMSGLLHGPSNDENE